MANIGLIDADKTNYPNLVLMKLSAYHKNKGDSVGFVEGFDHYDRIYISKVFDDTYSTYSDGFMFADEIIRGGTGYDMTMKLPDEIEHVKPDTSLYEIKDTAYGFLTRGCPRACPFCIVADKEGRKSVKVADLKEFWSGEKNIDLLDPNLLACKDSENLLKQLADSKAFVNFNQGLDARLLTKDNISLLNKINIKMLHFAWDLPEMTEQVLKGLELYAKLGKVQNFRDRRVYVITNFNTDHEYDIYRVEKLRKMNYDPYIMIYDKPHAPYITKALQRYVNNKFIFRSTKTFKDYCRHERIQYIQ